MNRLLPTFAILACAVVIVALTPWMPAYPKYLFDILLLTGAAAVALNLLMGCAGLVSIGSAAFLGIGAFTSIIAQRAGLPFPVDIALAALSGAVTGAIIGLPALRIRGLYLALATLAAHYIVFYAAQRYQTVAVGSSGFLIEPLEGVLGSPTGWTAICMVTLLVTVWIVARLSSGMSGSAWRMVRDHEGAAATLGIDPVRFKLMAFTISSALIAVVGAIMAHYDGVVSVESYGLNVAVAYLAMLVIGGMDSIRGALLGAIVVSLLPQLLATSFRWAFGDSGTTAMIGAQIAAMLNGALIVIFVVFAPGGLIRLVSRARRLEAAEDHDAKQP